MSSAVKQGQKLKAVWGPFYEGTGEQAGGEVGKLGVRDIEVSRLAGPMGWYDVAILQRDGWPSVILPLHMMESIVLLETSNQGETT